MKRTPTPAFAALLLLSLACASGSKDEALIVNPAVPVVRVGERLVLTAQAQEALASEPRWELKEFHGGGFLKTSGYQVTYLAPTSAGTYHVELVCKRPDGSTAKQILPINVLADASVEPGAPILQPGGTVQFSARMKGLPRSTVTWSVEEPEGGSISASGLYTAPPNAGTYHVLATSTVDTKVCASATVRVE